MKGPLPPAIEIHPLLLRVAEGDTQALAELYDATARYVFGILRCMLWSAESAERWHRRCTCRSGRPPGASIRSALRHGPGWPCLTRSRAIDRMRAEGSYREAVEDPQRVATRAALSDEPDGNLFQDVARSERAEVVHAALRDLPGEQRRARAGVLRRPLASRDRRSNGHTSRNREDTHPTALLKLRERLATEPRDMSEIRPRSIDEFQELAIAHLLGELDAAGAAAFDAELARRGAEGRAILRRLGQTLGEVALAAAPAEPPTALRSRVLASAGHVDEPQVRAVQGAPSWLWAAAAVLAVLAFGLGVWAARLASDGISFWTGSSG